MGITYKALEKYYKQRGRFPGDLFQDRNEENRQDLPVHGGMTEIQDKKACNPIDAARTSRPNQGDVSESDGNGQTSRSKRAGKAPPTAAAQDKNDRSSASNVRNRNHVRSKGYFRIYKIGKPTAKKILTNLRQDVVRKIIDFKYFLKIRDYLKYIDGELLKSENGRYYKIGFESRIMQSVQFDRQGNFINFIFSRKQRKASEDKHKRGYDLIDAGAIRSLEESFFSNFYGRFDIDMFKKLFEEVFKLSLAGDVVFREGRITALEGHVVYEVIFRSAVRFFLLMDVRGNYLDTAASDDLSEWERIFKDLNENKKISPPFSLLKDRRLLPE